MRNQHTTKGTGNDNQEYSRPNRKGTKKKQQQSSTHQIAGSAGQHYTSSSTNNVTTVVGGPVPPSAGITNGSAAAARAASSRSHSNNQTNGRKGHSVKKSSQKAMHLSQVGGKHGHAKKVGAAMHDLTSQTHYDQAYHLQPDSSAFREDQNSVYPVTHAQRSSSKMRHRHRKLTRQSSSMAGRGDLSTSSPHNDRQNTENQFFKLKTAIKQGASAQHKLISPELISSATAGFEAANMQHILEKQTFGGQPEFIISGHNNTISGTAIGPQAPAAQQKTIPILPQPRATQEASPNFNSEKQVRSYGVKSVTPQGFTNGGAENGMLSASGKFVITGIKNANQSNSQTPDRSTQVQQSIDKTRQHQMMQQQVRQQQNFKQHMQNVHLEIKGSTPAPQQNMFVGPKQVTNVPQHHINVSLAQGVSIQANNSPRLPEMQGSPSKTGTSAAFYHHQPSSLKPNNNSSRTDHVGHQNSITKTLDAQQTPHFDGQLGGLQNSKSPFQSKQSHKQLRGSLNPNSIRESIMAPGQETKAVKHQQNSPVITSKKQNSAKNSLRMQSAKKDSQNFYNSGSGNPIVNRNTALEANNLQGLTQITLSGTNTIPLPQGHIKTVPIVTQVFAHKSLKAQGSQQKIGSSPEKLAQKQEQHAANRHMGNFFMTGAAADASTPEVKSSHLPQNVSGLLNMSKQRAYTMDADQSMEQPQTQGQQPELNAAMMPKDVKVPGTQQQQQSPQKKAFKVKHDNKRSDSQHATRAQKSNYQNHQSQLAYTPHNQSNNANFGKKSSLAPIGSDGGSFQKSGKQIIIGQQQLQNHQQQQSKQQMQQNKMTEMAGGLPQNKTLPLSLFEMQFYQGDFILNSQQQQQNQVQSMQSTKANFNSKNSTSVQLQQVQAQTQQQQLQHMHPQLKIAANGALQPQQFLSKNGLQTASMSSMIKHASTLQDLYHTPQQERNKISLLPGNNFNQQWVANMHAGSQVYPHQQPQQQHMPARQTSGSQSNLGMPVQHLSKANSPMKMHSASKHHGHNMSLTMNNAQQNGGITMQTLLQQNKGQLPPHLLQQQMMNSMSSQTNLYGGPVSVNGRQMSLANQAVLGVNPQNFTQVPPGQSPQVIPQVIPPVPARSLQTEMQQAYMNSGITDPFELLQLQNQVAEHFSHQLYALQLQSHQKAAQQSFQERKRRDTNIFKRAVSKIPFENAYVEDCYKFIIGYGNNSNIIRLALKQRSWWIEIQPVHSMFNFKWLPVSDGIKFARLGHMDPNQNKDKPSIGNRTTEGHAASGQDKFSLQMVNHLEHHQLLTEKYNLLMVMQRFCDAHKENTFEIMPITFFVEISDASRDQLITQALTPFSTLWHTLEANKRKLDQLKKTLQRQLHQKNNLEEKESNDVAGGAKPNQALLDKLQRLESVTGAQAQTHNSGKVTKFKTFNFDKRTYQKYTMPLCHFDSYNLWLLKPTHLNRGRGIHVFNDLDTLNKLIKQYCSGKEEGTRKKEQPKENLDKTDCGTAEASMNETGMDTSTTTPMQQQNIFDNELDDFGQATQSAQKSVMQQSSPPKKPVQNKIKHNTFIIQKYIEKPLLIYKRKFDIRVWVLLTHEHELFFFKEGYLRTSSTEFGIDLQNIDDAFVHLTNNAVQKHAENYGDFEDGNQLSFPAFQDYIDQHYPESGVLVYDHLVPQMHEVILKTFNAVRRTIDPNRRKFCFELFGYDFILDEDFNSWLIEVNTNPCLEESSELLKKLLPRMIEDMFKLTIDVVFPKSGIRKRKEGGKNKKGTTASPTKVSKKAEDLNGQGQSPQKRVGTAKKTISMQLQSSEDQKYRVGGQTDTEQQQTPTLKEIPQLGSKTNSTDATSLLDHGFKSQKQQSSDNGEFSDINRDETTAHDKAAPDSQQLMTIKEKLNRNRVYPVPGYSDSQNMWTRLGNIEKDPIPTQSKFHNKKSCYLLQVQDKVFKMRKNPAYTGPLNLPEMGEPEPDEVLAPDAIAEEDDALGEAGGENNEDL